MARTKSISFPNSLSEFEDLFDKLQRSAINRLLNAGGLALKTSGSKLAKTVNTIYVMIDGAIISKAAGDMPSLPASVVSNTKYNIFVITINASGTLACYAGTQAATLAGVVTPEIPEGEVAIGMIIIHPTGTGDFTGNTTALDDATVAPNAAYVDLIGSFLPELAEL